METTNKSDLMNSAEFDNAILEAVKCKKNIDSSYKQSNKANYERFYQTMLDGDSHIQSILDKPSRKRTDYEKEAVKIFKNKVRKEYNYITDFLSEEKPEEGKESKMEKFVSKLSYMVEILRYIGNKELDKIFEDRGMRLGCISILSEHFENEDIKKNMVDIFETATKLRKSVNDENTNINENIFTTKVPIDLQFNKEMNQGGIKPTDFRKLVNMKSKLEAAVSDEAKEKVEEKIQNLATAAQFDVSRSELIRDKLTNL